MYKRYEGDISKLKPLTLEQAKELKVGDEVVCIDPNGLLSKGAHYVITRFDKVGVFVFVRNDRGYIVGYDRERFAPLPDQTPFSCEDELDRLIRKANEGGDAFEAIIERYQDDVIVGDERGYKLLRHANGFDSSCRFRRKPEPKLPEPWTTSNGYTITITEKTVTIGCLTVKRKTARGILEQILDHKTGKLNMVSIKARATKDGIYSKAHGTLPWPDAEKLYEQLKALEEAK